MNSKEIGRLAGRIFLAGVPAHVAVRSQEDQEDYGVDYEFELMAPGDIATGLIFKLQQKGHLVLTNLRTEQAVSHALDRARLRYYLEEIRIPIILVVVGVKAQEVYWLRLQGEDAVLKAYNSSHGQESVTLRIPKCQTLPATFDQLVAAVVESQEWLTVRDFRRIASWKLQAHVKDSDSSMSLTDDLRDKTDTLRVAHMERLLQAGAMEELWSTARAILCSDSEQIPLRFVAGVNLIRTAHSRERQETVAVRLNVSSYLVGLVRRKREFGRYACYALFMGRAAKLAATVERDFMLHMSLKLQQQTGDDYTRSLTAAEKAVSTRDVVASMHRALRAVMRMAEQGMAVAVPLAIAQLVSDLTPFMHQLAANRATEQAADMLKSSEGLLEMAVDMAVQQKRWSDVSGCAAIAVGLGIGKDEAGAERALAFALQLLSKIEDAQERETAEQEILLHARELRQQSSSQNLTTEALRIFYERMAVAMGIDLSDETDPIARAVRIGIDDLNPERLLRHCEHLAVGLEGGGMVSQMMGLPSAGMKGVRCLKFDHYWRSLSLDTIIAGSITHECGNCPSRTPRPADWRWSREWQREQEESLKPMK